jgi:hypothetical protein
MSGGNRPEQWDATDSRTWTRQNVIVGNYIGVFLPWSASDEHHF